MKGIGILRGIPIRIPNHRAPNHELTGTVCTSTFLENQSWKPSSYGIPRGPRKKKLVPQTISRGHFFLIDDFFAVFFCFKRLVIFWQKKSTPPGNPMGIWKGIWPGSTSVLLTASMCRFYMGFAEHVFIPGSEFPWEISESTNGYLSLKLPFCTWKKARKPQKGSRIAFQPSIFRGYVSFNEGRPGGLGILGYPEESQSPFIFGEPKYSNHQSTKTTSQTISWHKTQEKRETSSPKTIFSSKQNVENSKLLQTLQMSHPNKNIVLQQMFKSPLATRSRRCFLAIER